MRAFDKLPPANRRDIETYSHIIARAMMRGETVENIHAAELRGYLEALEAGSLLSEGERRELYDEYRNTRPAAAIRRGQV